MKAFFSKRNIFSSIVSIVLSVVFVASVTFASTTISTNISTDGTLAVTGASTLTGAVTTAGAVTLGDAAGDAIIITGNASTTNALTVGSNLYIGGNATTTGSTGNFQTMGGLTIGDATANALAGTILLSAQTSDPTGVTQGTFYYNSTSKVLKMFDGTNWFTVGTTTSGISLSGARLQLADLTTQYVTFGTSTPIAGGSAAVVTIQATSTVSIPLVIEGILSQTGDLFNIRDDANAKLLYVTSGGNLFATGTAQVTGAFTTYGATTLGDAAGDTITPTGNASALGTLSVTGLTTMAIGSSTGAFSLEGTSANFMVNGLATTTASTGDIGTLGKIGVGTTTPTTLELSAEGSATTTVAAFSSGTLTGGCIQISATDGTLYRMYVNPADVATTTSGHAGIIALWEAGSCK